MVDAKFRQQVLEATWLERQRERAAAARRKGAGRKPNVAGLYANLPPPPSEDEWRAWQDSQSGGDPAARRPVA